MKDIGPSTAIIFQCLPTVGGFPNRVTVDQLHPFIRRLELGTKYIKTIPSFDNSVLTINIMYLIQVLAVNYLFIVIKLIDTL